MCYSMSLNWIIGMSAFWTTGMITWHIQKNTKISENSLYITGSYACAFKTSTHTLTWGLSGPFFQFTLCVCTCEVEGKGDEAVVFAEDAERLLSLYQCEEVICHGLTIEEVVHTKQEVPVRQRVEQMYTSHSFVTAASQTVYSGRTVGLRPNFAHWFTSLLSITLHCTPLLLKSNSTIDSRRFLVFLLIGLIIYSLLKKKIG